jgi:hypothetical protein
MDAAWRSAVLVVRAAVFFSRWGFGLPVWGTTYAACEIEHIKDQSRVRNVEEMDNTTRKTLHNHIYCILPTSSKSRSR